MKTAPSAVRWFSLFGFAALAAACGAAGPGEEEDLDSDSWSEALGPSACAVSYTVGAEWTTGFAAAVTITNTSGAPYNGWTLTWTFPSGQTVGSHWDAQMRQAGAKVTVTNAGWNGAVPAGGAVSFGFNGTRVSANAAPTDFAVNGVACNGSGGGTSSSSASSSSSGSGSGGSGAGGTGGSGGSGGAGGSGFAALVSQATYETMFPQRNALFSYQALATATQSFAEFASAGTSDQRKREVAAFLANIGHETTGGWPTAPGGPYAWGLYFTQEVGCEGGACTGYCEPSNTQYPCAPGKTYHGRGPMQLSYNYNYGAAGAALGLNLLANPDLVTSDGVTSFKTALWFWMTPQAPKPSAHAVMTGGWTPSAQDAAVGRQPGFGMTVNIINGGIECSKPTPAQVQDRLGFYQRFTTMLGVDPGTNLTCDQMAHY